MSSWYAGVVVVTVGNHVCQCLVVLSDPLVGGWSCLVVSCPCAGMRVCNDGHGQGLVYAACHG